MNDLRSIALSGLAALALVACNAAPQPPSSHPPLASSSAQPGFNFATSRAVEVQLSSTKGGAISITSPDGKLLFSGNMSAGAPLRLKLPIATRDEKLIAALRTEGVSTRVELPIVSGLAAHAFN